MREPTIQIKLGAPPQQKLNARLGSIFTVRKDRNANVRLLSAKYGTTHVPQVWLTDAELGDELDRPVFVARATAISNGWTRKKSLDGLSRTRLPDTMMSAFILKAAQRFVDSEVCVNDTMGKRRSGPIKSPLSLLWSKIA